MEALLWALRLAVLGRSRPVPDEVIIRIEERWMSRDAAARDKAMSDLTTHWEALQASGMDIAQKAGVVLAIFALAVLPMQITLQDRSGNHELAWFAIVLLAVSILIILMMLTPKLKVWRKHDWDNEVIGVARDLTRVEHYKWLVHKTHHRRQLVAFERRSKSLAVGLALIALVLEVLAL